MRKYCDTCGKSHNVIIKEEERKYKVKGINVTAKLNITYCAECGEEVYNRKEELKNDIIIFDSYKKEVELLTSKEIKELRKKFDVTQETLAKLLGFGLKTITRYENGSIQDEAYDTVLKLIRDEVTFKKLFHLRKHKLNKTERNKIEKKLQELKYDLGDIEYKVEKNKRV